ncbi:MAG: cytochrome c [Chloroflexi bacterium]|nr:cytochrome c [Chloroflexota bacterium]
MKLRHSILLAIIAVVLTACNFTLAEDVTPPPDYKPPAPAPTMSPLFPAAAPDPASGAALYAENCAPCHGATGMGDGPQAAMLQGQDVTIPALGSAEFAQDKTPAAWYQMVTQGNIKNFMPPFSSLDDQQRWDVVAYAFTLHTTPEQIEKGKSLCGDCAQYFGSQEMMSALSESDLVNLMKNGMGDVPAFGKDFSEDDALAVAAYIRSLTFAQPIPPTVDSATETPVNADSGTPLPEGTSQPGAESTPEPISGGTVSGSIQNQTGTDLPKDVKVTLRGYAHGGDMSTAPEEVVTLEGVLNDDGTFVFADVDVSEGLIFRAEATMDGTTYRSDFAVVEAGMTDVSLSVITVYATTEDLSALKIDSLQMYFDLANAENAQMFAVYNITNSSDKTVVVKVGDAAEIPFIAFPAGAEGLGYEAAQGSAPFMEIDGGFAMPPSETPYGLIAYSSLPNAKEIPISQAALLPIEKITLLLPEGVEVEGDTLIDGGTQSMTESMNFHVYTASGLAKGETLDFTLKGKPQETAVNPDITQNKTLLFGVGGLGVALILAGAFLFWRDRRREEEPDEEEDGDFQDPESLMDAIIALDDLHRAGKIPDEAYQRRRGELKDALKRKA